MRALVLSVGDELVSGLALDTNSAWLSRELAAEGIATDSHMTVGDDRRAIVEALRALAPKAEVLVVTGGLGPTPDDLTREALAEVMDATMAEDARWLEHLTEFFEKRGRVMQPGNRKQALIPRSATLLWNPLGTAAGIAADIRTGSPSRSGGGEVTCHVIVLPGVPSEMQAMFEAHVRPWLREGNTRRGGRIMRTRALHAFGIGESDLAARLGDLLRRRPESEGLQVGTTAAGGVVSIRVYAAGATEAEAEQKLMAVEVEARQKLGQVIFGRDRETLAEVVGRMLREHPAQPVLRVAESCTGGLLAQLITDVAGSSDYFDRGFITYANQAKSELLGVPRELIEAHGAVSEEVVAAMAAGALSATPLPERRGGVSVSISGVAGPGGGTPQKPVGMVCIGLASSIAGDTEPSVAARTFSFGGDRRMIRERAAMMALAMLRYHLLGLQMPL